jgi:trigger factor
MKKTIAILLALALLLCAFAGCVKKTAEIGAGDLPQSELSGNGGEPTEEQRENQSDAGEAAGNEAGEYVPDYSFYSAGLTEEDFFEGVTASDIVELPDYKGIPIPASAVGVYPEELDEFLRSQILASYAETVEVTDRPVENYDTVNIDYTGYVDDVAFDGGSTQGRGTDVTIGVTSYIDDFLEQLIGHEPGETFDIFVTFPDPYPNSPDLSGRDARFNVTINYIVEKTPAELTDDVARDYGFEDKAGLLARVEEVLLDDARTSFLSGLLTQAVCPEVPESVIEYFENYFIGIYSVSYGIDLSDSRQELLEGSEETMRSLAVTYLAAQAICEKEGLRASDADLEALGLLSDLELYGLPFAKQTAIMKRVLPEFILANGIPEA